MMQSLFWSGPLSAVFLYSARDSSSEWYTGSDVRESGAVFTTIQNHCLEAAFMNHVLQGLGFRLGHLL